ncbi:MAG: hypothetical protein R3Y18_00910 [Bacillota bacterium]
MKRFFINWFEKTVEKTKLSNSFVDAIFVLVTMLVMGAFAIDSYLFDNLAKVSVRFAYIPFVGLSLLSILIIAVLTFYNGVVKRHGYAIAVVGGLVAFKLILTVGTSLALTKIGSVLYFMSNWIINLSISGFLKYLFLEKMLSEGEMFLLLLSFIGIIYTIGYLFSFIKKEKIKKEN